MAQIKANLFYYIRTKGFIWKWKLLTVNIHIGNHRTFFYLRCCHNARGRVKTGSVDPEAVRPSDWTYCSQKPEWEKMQIYLDEMKCKYIFIFGKSNSARQSLTYLILIIFNIFWKMKNEKSHNKSASQSFTFLLIVREVRYWLLQCFSSARHHISTT